MAREKIDNKLNVVVGTKAQTYGDTSIPENSIIIVTDEELKADEIVYSTEKNVKEAIESLEASKQDKLAAGDNITIVGNTISAGVDLSNYFNKTEINSLLGDKVDKVAGKQLSTEDFTTAEKTKLSGIAANAQVNVLEGVQLNGTDVAISNKKSNIVVNKTTVGLGNVANVDTTNPANITQNATHRFVTDTEKLAWDGKQNALGFTPENVANKVTTITSSSTNAQYPTAKAVYDMIGDIESVLDNILGV